MVEILKPTLPEAICDQRQMLLEVERLTFGYSEQPLLSSVNLSIRSGEMLALLGPNGSGKTTLLRLLSGLFRPQQGRIVLQGRELSTWGRREIARRLAVVPQEFQVPFAFTVEQIVALGRTPFISPFGGRTKRDQEIVHQALHEAEVEHLALRVFNQLSGGERQRVLLAMALAQQPQVLLLDEPTSHLDIKYQIEMLELLNNSNRRTGLTILAAMHDLNLAARYFPRLLLFQGSIVADGGPAEVLRPDLLKRVYGVEVQVGIMPHTQHLSVHPAERALNHENIAEHAHPANVHLISGGGSGALIMRALADAGIPFSAGVLSPGDSDYLLAQHLASDVIVEEPFAPVSEENRQCLRQHLQNCSLLLVALMPLGSGNLALLEEALLCCQRGTPVLLLLNASVEDTTPALGTLEPEQQLALFNSLQHHFANGSARRLSGQLLQAGAILMSDISEILEYIHQL